ncbi:MAG: glycosyltransferase [Chitinophagaceae bacterium]|nr:glycosyltransferase [Chitinophagaceae bacterium]
MPQASVIIPNHNHASFLEERIQSVLKQGFTDFEMIILDDGLLITMAHLIGLKILLPLKTISSILINWETKKIKQMICHYSEEIKILN